MRTLPIFYCHASLPSYTAMSEPSALPDPHTVLESTSALPAHTTSRLIQDEEEQLLKFFIGLRLLGQEKQKRYLSYLAAVVKEQKAKDEPHDHNGI